MDILSHFDDQWAHLGLIGLSTLFLLLGSYKTNRFYSIIGLAVLIGEYYRSHIIGAHFSLPHIGMEMMLVGLLALTGLPKHRKDIKWYASVALTGLLLGHLFISLIDNMIFKAKSAVDPEAELLISFNTSYDKNTWINKWKQVYDIDAMPFKPHDLSSTLLDEYASIDIKQNANLINIISQLEADPLIRHVELNDAYKIDLPDHQSLKTSPDKRKQLNDPNLTNQWSAKQFDLELFHNKLNQASNAHSDLTWIAILDTGVDAKHEDLKANYKSFGIKNDKDKIGHGTHCAGIAAAVSNNGIGIASWIPGGLNIKVGSIQVLGSFGMGTQKAVIDGIIKAADKGADVISLSLGGRTNDKRELAYKEAVEYANKKGAIVVVAAGNSSSDAKFHSPANTKNVLAITAIDRMSEKAEFANTVTSLEFGLAAPGTNILSTMPNNIYKTQNGTSMATPYVSGIVGIMKHLDKSLTTKEVYKILSDTAIKKDGLLIVNPNGVLDYMIGNNRLINNEE